jgi:endonuclease III
VLIEITLVILCSIRTILSQNTTNNNSRRAYESLLETFGPGKDSKRVVDLLEIYKAEVAVVQEAIK